MSIFDSGGGHLDSIEDEITTAPPTVTLLHADAHQHGPGKVHVLEEGRTRCGKQRASCPGRVEFGDPDEISCKGCLNSLDADRRRERQQHEWQQRQAERQAEREEQNRQWWEWYDEYLVTPEWRARRELVLRRAGGICEGCLQRRATQVHHRTYEHVGDELCFELVGVCDQCHARIHDKKAA